MADPETAPCLNGPKLAAWLRERDRMPVYLGPSRRGQGDPVESLRRRVECWAGGEQADAYTADRWLTFCGCHLSEIPDDFWEDAKPRPKRRFTEEDRQRILEMAKDKTPTEASREFGISPKTIASWRARVAA